MAENVITLPTQRQRADGLWVCDAHPTYARVDIAGCPGCAEDRAESWREEGRREVLREIAQMEPGSPSDSYCTFCGALAKYHKPACLWLQAQAVKDAE